MSATRYAAETEVSSEKSRQEIERILTRYGASRFAYATEPGRAMVQFEAHDRRVRFVVPLPDPEADRFVYQTRSGRILNATRSPQERARAYEQATRQVWRVLALVVKAKLEAVESGLSEFSDEFLAHIVVPGTNETVGQWMRPQLDRAYAGGMLPAMLPGS